jgi:hypothetical protein
LQELCSYDDYCVGYAYLDHLADRKILKQEVQILKALDLVEYHRGLFNIDDGSLAGSGFCRSEKGDKFIEKYEL